MIVLDTNVISEVVRPSPNPTVVTWLESVSDEVAITAITLAELLAGLGRLPEGRRRDVLTSAIEAALQPYRQSRAILAFDSQAAQAYAHVLAARQKAGKPITMADAEIAAICRTHQATLATRNTSDFEFTGVQWLNPWNTNE